MTGIKGESNDMCKKYQWSVNSQLSNALSEYCGWQTLQKAFLLQEASVTQIFIFYFPNLLLFYYSNYQKYSLPSPLSFTYFLILVVLWPCIVCLQFCFRGYSSGCFRLSHCVCPLLPSSPTPQISCGSGCGSHSADSQLYCKTEANSSC